MEVGENFDLLEGPCQGEACLGSVSRLMQRVEFGVLDLDVGGEGVGFFLEIAVARNLAGQSPVELLLGSAK